MDPLLRTLLYEWRDRKLPELIERDIHLDTSKELDTKTATIITGFRRVGKTYLVFEAIEKLLQNYTREEVIYINFEDERIQPQTELLTNLLPEIQAIFGKKPVYLFLDELQLIPDWSKWARRILDTESIHLYITGSSSKMSSFELPTELRGRSQETRVFPLSFTEFLRFKNILIDTEKMAHVQDERARFEYLFNEYLLYGGLPAVVLAPEAKKQELLQSYFQTVVQKEIGERFNIENDLALKTLLKLLLNSTYVTVSKLHNSLKSMAIPVGKSTVDNYISYIESSYFMKELFIYNTSVINQLQYPRKVYFIDTGFMTALSTKFSKNFGRLFENIVFNRLSQQYDILHYYKDDNDYEVDFVVFDQNGVDSLYQVCFDLSDEETHRREVRSLLKAGTTLDCTKLYIITLNKDANTPIPEEIKVLTAEKFFWD